jgi:hypothetical protein
MRAARRPQHLITADLLHQAGFSANGSANSPASATRVGKLLALLCALSSPPLAPQLVRFG